ncbi:MAG: hypothetical protein H0U23_05300 [Blastocatellia bacterium]|nr:hypothetical protein [Blastocatellia bacterium]
MQGVDGITGDVFGLYELATDGTVLYSRPRAGEVLHEPTQVMVGRDFFREVALFENKEDLRHHFRRFLHGDESVNAFTFDCFYGADVVKAKIFMTRAYKTNDEHSGTVVILDIRSAGQ